MMPRAGVATAYLITPYMMTASGELIEEAGTVCFDLALALEMAKSDCTLVAGVCVFALDAFGTPTDPKPIATFGLHAPSGPPARGRSGDEANGSIWIC